MSIYERMIETEIETDLCRLRPEPFCPTAPIDAFKPQWRRMNTVRMTRGPEERA
jgi:hypothetical protein